MGISELNIIQLGIMDQIDLSKRSAWLSFV